MRVKITDRFYANVDPSLYGKDSAALYDKGVYLGVFIISEIHKKVDAAELLEKQEQAQFATKFAEKVLFQQAKLSPYFIGGCI